MAKHYMTHPELPDRRIEVDEQGIAFRLRAGWQDTGELVPEAAPRRYLEDSLPNQSASVDDPNSPGGAPSADQSGNAGDQAGDGDGEPAGDETEGQEKQS